MSHTYEFRDPIHGFIQINEWERAIIDHPAFQRLRRIRQLAWTDMVYPGAMHTRFEHSLGVMHVATLIYRALLKKHEDIFKNTFGLVEGGKERQEARIRLAALLHDVGHSPFSHAGEEILPFQDEKEGKRYVHEDYSAAIIHRELRDVIENHPHNKANLNLKIDDILEVLGTPQSGLSALFKDIISGQMDADRMDYLQRDSYHAGVRYGMFDMHRVINTVCLCPDGEGGYHIGVEDGGLQAIEGLLIARYMMFTQLYFHKTRVIYDYHLEQCLQEILKDNNGVFPAPNSTGSIKAYLKWDDWEVLGAIKQGKGGVHGDMLLNRKHYKLIHQTSQVPDKIQLDQAEELCKQLKAFDCVKRDAKKSWYKFSDQDIPVKLAGNNSYPASKPLSVISPVIKALLPVNQRLLYVPEHNRVKAEEVRQKLLGEKK
jgi:uncharacterized protein